MRRLIRLLVVLLALAGASAAPVVAGFFSAVAQDVQQAPDFESWEKVANRAEIALANKRVSNGALADLRLELVSWRKIFLAARDFDQSRLATLQNQLTALGPEPEPGASEAPDIASRRSVLLEQIAAVEAPQLSAKEAYSRADGLITETDRIYRERTKERLLTAGPTPLNLKLWPAAIDTLVDTFQRSSTEFRSTVLSRSRQKIFRDSLPATIFFSVIAIVFSLRGRYWVETFAARFEARTSAASRRIFGFLISIGQLVVPVIGVTSFALALHSTGLLGFRGTIIADTLPVIAFGFFLARWLSSRLFPKSDTPKPLLELSVVQGARIRWYAGALGLFWGAESLLKNLADFDRYSVASKAVLDFPVSVVCGILLFRVGKILLSGLADRAEQSKTGDAKETKFQFRALNLTGRALLMIGVAGPVLAAVGYHAAAVALIYPTIASLALMAVLNLLSGLTRDIYSVVTRGDEERTDNALIPVLISFALVVLAIPLFALIWGVRASELSEIWDKIAQGYQIGDTVISPSQFFAFVAVFIIGYGATKLLQSTLRTSVLPKTRIDPGGQVAVISGIGYIGVTLAALIAISTAGINLSSLAIVAGALSVGIGFGLQNIVSNFVSGVILLVERPITEGDWIEVGGNMGTVREISVRSTRIETFDRTDVIIPNSDLVSGTVTNFTRGNVTGRTIIAVGVAYGSDTRRVQEILTEIAEANPIVLKWPAPSVHFVDFGADSLDFEIRAILRDVNERLSVNTDIRHEITRRFTEEGIEIPFAQRDVWLRNPETLHAPPAKPAPKPKPKPKDTAI